MLTRRIFDPAGKPAGAERYETLFYFWLHRKVRSQKICIDTIRDSVCMTRNALFSSQSAYCEDDQTGVELEAPKLPACPFLAVAGRSGFLCPSFSPNSSPVSHAESLRVRSHLTIRGSQGLGDALKTCRNPVCGALPSVPALLPAAAAAFLRGGSF